MSYLQDTLPAQLLDQGRSFQQWALAKLNPTSPLDQIALVGLRHMLNVSWYNIWDTSVTRRISWGTTRHRRISNIEPIRLFRDSSLAWRTSSNNWDSSRTRHIFNFSFFSVSFGSCQHGPPQKGQVWQVFQWGAPASSSLDFLSPGWLHCGVWHAPCCGLQWGWPLCSHHPSW